MEETEDPPAQPDIPYPAEHVSGSREGCPFKLADADGHVVEMQTRVLYPFTFDADQITHAELSRRLQETKFEERAPRKAGEDKRSFLCWAKTEVAANSLYAEEATPPLIHFLFGGSEDGAQMSGGRWLMPSNTHSYLFRNRLHLASEQKGKLLEAPAGYQTDIKFGDVELFLSSLGVGVLSFSVTPAMPPKLADAKSLNYWLSQQGKKKREARLYLPGPGGKPRHTPSTAALINPAGTDDSAEASHGPAQIAALAPVESAPFEERMGRAGEWFTLNEMKDLLLGAIQRTGGGEGDLQEQFSVYTSVHFDRTIRFSNEDCRRALAPLLAGLTQVEEATHPGAASLEHLGVESEVLNAQHWAAVGSLGAAHLISDDEDERLADGFNRQRTGHVQTKYFTSFLLAYFQNIFLGLLEREAADIVRGTSYPPTESSIKVWAKKFPILRQKLLVFDLLAALRFASQREVHNRAYRLAQEGLGVHRAFGDIARAISEMEAACRFLRQGELLNTQTENIGHLVVMQRKVEIVEVFLISVYSIYFFHYAGDPFFTDYYVGSWTIGGPVAAAAVAYHFLVREAQHAPHSLSVLPDDAPSAGSDQARGAGQSKKQLLKRLFPPVLIWLIAGIMTLYLLVGYWWFQEPEKAYGDHRKSATLDAYPEPSRHYDALSPEPTAAPWPAASVSLGPSVIKVPPADATTGSPAGHGQ